MRVFNFLAALLSLAVCATAAEFEQARFIAPPAGRAADAACPLFRKEFTLNSKPKTATLRIIGLGDYEVSLNGRRLAATAMNQPWSDYEKTLYYRDFDLAPALVAGPNCLGVMLYNSFWHNPNPPAGRYNKKGIQRTTTEPFLLCAEITVTEKDGTVVRIGTDASWRLTDGPVVFSHIYAGEDFDARRQLPGWDRAGFDDRSWQTAREIATPAGRLEPQLFPNVSTFAHQKPVSVKRVQPQASALSSGRQPHGPSPRTPVSPCTPTLNTSSSAPATTGLSSSRMASSQMSHPAAPSKMSPSSSASAAPSSSVFASSTRCMRSTPSSTASRQSARQTMSRSIPVPESYTPHLATAPMTTSPE
jgi:hypothetical protein